ncbi:MAG: CBASS oligonucleotide cyclase [Thermoleophilia bacterium]|nr:CBASS oligonucleotide cyclase [Thermoleophilia bacterium]
MPTPPSTLIDPPIAHADVRRFAEDKVNLPADIARERRQKVNDLRERLGKWMKDHPDCGLAKSYLSGSLAKGTALRTSSDVDVALYITYDGERKANRQLSNWIAERLRKAYPQMSPDQIEPQEFSVKIKFKEAGVDVDIVPVFYEGDQQDKGWLVSKKTGRLILTSIPMHLAFTRKRKDAQPQHFAQVVRLIKWWAAEQKAKDASFRFKSFMVELICAHLADGGQDFSDYRKGMEAFFNYIVSTGLESRIAFKDYYSASDLPRSLPDVVQIFDPVNAKNNVASQYTEANRKLIVEAAQDALNALIEAHTASTKADAVAMWRVVLGTSFRG